MGRSNGKRERQINVEREIRNREKEMKNEAKGRF